SSHPSPTKRKGIAMTCPKPEVLSQWADGSLDRRESLAVSRHAETCDACRRKAEELRAVGAWVATAGEPGRACLSADDMAAVLETTETAKPEPLRPNPFAPKAPPESTTDPVVKDTPTTTPKETVVQPPAPPTPKTPEAPRPMAALNVRSGSLTALADGKW